jgi:hypothetical protein
MPEAEQNSAVYVYGIVPGDVEVTPDARGIGDREVRLVRCGDIAALVSDIDVHNAIGRPDDLLAHEGLLDSIITELPVLPFRFGAVMANEKAVSDELLDPNRDEFAGALRELEGQVEYVVRGRYVENAILREVIASSEEVARLRDQIRDGDEDATRPQRIRLGELVYGAVETHRDADARALIEALSAHSVAQTPLEPTHEYDTVPMACLVETSKRAEFEDAVDDLSHEWKGRVDFRLLGPLAPYDFVLARR